ncbi:hypothetical protein [Chitinophaga sp.]|uniref:hypothetical protein n=1 Tax=Chitinophaga sp. TaxID=1869181 RepID=UPI0031D55D96
MATYFRKYYIEFKDRHIIQPATWRVDIMDSQGEVPSEPFRLIASDNPLITERLETDDNKANYIIGRQITLAYEYTGSPNEPLPEDFFESDERRWRVEVRKNGVLDGVYYIRPDYSQRTVKYPPITVTLKAVDGLSYAKAVPFSMADESGLLLYDKISSYEAIMTRALGLILDAGTPLNVICSLTPENMEPGKQLFNGTFIHTDIFYDFVKGASTVHEVLTAYCKAFYARCFIAHNQVWFVRMQDLTGDTFTAEQYAAEGAVTDVALPGFVRTAGPDPALYDGLPIDEDPELVMVPAIKKQEHEVQYKGINRLLNYDWHAWDGSAFDNWTVEPTFPLIVGRTGAGTQDNPYKLFIPYPQLPTATDIQQQQPVGGIFLGDTFDLELKYRFTNVKAFRISISVTNNDIGGVSFRLMPDGSWIVGNSLAGLFTVTRGGRKREGTLKIKSNPIPIRVEGTANDQTGPFGLRVEFFAPFSPEEMEPGEPAGVEIYPIKLGVYSIPSKGRHLTATNGADFSRVIEEPDKFTFIDTGDDGVSNSIFTGAAKEPVNGWMSTKPGVAADDIERHMARAHIDQYRRSLYTWDGSLYSNSLEYFNPIELAGLPGKRFMQMRDTYVNITCTHTCSLMEIMEEGSAAVDIVEYDIEEERDE